MQLQALQIAGPDGAIKYLDDAEVAAGSKTQDYARAWPMWRQNALAKLRP
jgi:hypothetical protein